MSNAAGVYKLVSLKKETTFGVLPSAASAQAMRRVSCDLSLTKDTYRSNEIRPDMQVSDFRHGVRRATGKLSDDLSAGTLSLPFGSFCKRLFTAGVSTAGASITIAGTGPTYTLTRAAGSYLTDGFKRGHVIRLSVGTFNAANINKNLYVQTVTATILTVTVLNQSALVAEGPISASTVAVFGKQTWVATSGQIEESYALEQWSPDVPSSETFTGVKINGFNLNLPATGIATVDFDLLAQGMTPATVQYFTSPTAATTTGSMAAVNGLMQANGITQAILTGITLTGTASYTGDPVVGQNVIPAFYPGILEVKGQATAYFADTTLRDAFLNETEIDIIVVFTADNTATSDFVSFVLPRVKLTSFTKSDGAGAITATMGFQALLNKNGGAGIQSEFTTMLIQDSAA